VSVRDKVFMAAERLAKLKPYDQITFAEVAEAADVHWTAVRRHFGSKDRMREWLKVIQSNEPGVAEKDTRSRIVRSAEIVFSTYGYERSSLDKVAEHAGLSKGAVYWHFSSKHELFVHVLEKVYDEQIRALPVQMEHVLASEDPVHTFMQWLETQFLCLAEADGRAKLLMYFLVSELDAEVKRSVQQLHAKFLDTVAVHIYEMQQKRLVSDEVDARALAAMLDSLLKGVLIEWLLDPSPGSLATLTRTISTIWWRGAAVKK